MGFTWRPELADRRIPIAHQNLNTSYSYQCMLEGRCISCGRGLVEEGYAQFPCPECGYIIKRCAICRSQVAVYKCPECGFEGP